MLEQLKILLEINGEELDTKLELLIELATMRLTVLLGGLEPTSALDYIVIGVCLKKFNKIGSEGLSSHNVEGENMTFEENDFAEYADDIDEYLKARAGSSRGKVRFL